MNDSYHNKQILFSILIKFILNSGSVLIYVMLHSKKVANPLHVMQSQQQMIYSKHYKRVGLKILCSNGYRHLFGCLSLCVCVCIVIQFFSFPLFFLCLNNGDLKQNKEKQRN